MFLFLHAIQRLCRHHATCRSIRQYFSSRKGLPERQTAPTNIHEDNTHELSEGDRQIFTHTEIDDSLSGKGMGSMLVRKSLDDARQRGKRIVPVCEFIGAYVKKHPDWNDLLEQPS